jgi:dTDP-4-dehydrorhamnose 3,5-epimerase
MDVSSTTFPLVLVVESAVFADDRGFFSEAWNHREFSAAVGSEVDFVQDNLSRSVKGVVRGLHYQLPPVAQGKLVRAVTGELFDVVVDIRRSSSTFGHWFGLVLSADNNRQLWIPPGFAHGFQVLSDSADLLYKTTEYFSPEHERSIRWNDPDVAIDWPGSSVDALLSEKDLTAPFLADADVLE